MRSVVSKLIFKCLRVTWVEMTSQLLKTSLEILGRSEVK